MTSIDTNVLFAASFAGHQDHAKALDFFQQFVGSRALLLSEYVLVELYNLLRNELLVGKKVSSAEAVDQIQALRNNPDWAVIESAPIMDQVWKWARKKGFARRRIFDVRIALTLRHHGVTDFATVNGKDFRGLGFQRVWNPLAE